VPLPGAIPDLGERHRQNGGGVSDGSFPSIVFQALGIALSVGFLASLYPAWRVARINPIEVIRAS
jgi:hypothetical protein